MNVWQRKLLIFLWLPWLAFSGAGHAAEPASSGEQSRFAPLEFRRMYAPADQPHRWPIGDAEYWPVAADEFERLLRAARAGSALTDATHMPRLVAAEYQAQLIGKQWLEGRATLDVEHADNRAALLSLAPWGMAIRQARWQSNPPIPAELGASPLSTPAVRVERPGRLELDWSLAADSTDPEVTAFTLDLPLCPISRLWLVLPATLRPETDTGVVIAPSVAEGPTRRWRIELGPSTRVELRLVSTDAEPPGPEVRLSESSVFNVSMHGIDLAAQWRLTVSNSGLRELPLQLDRGLVLVSARYSDTPIPWSEQSQQSGKRVVLELPEEVSGKSRTLHLRAVAPVVIDHPCRLPRIHPEKARWHEGSLTLVVPKPLVLRNVEPIGCQQIDRAPLVEPRQGESARFRNYQPGATLRVELGRPESLLTVASGTQVRLGAEQATAEVLAHFTLNEGVRYEIEAAIGPGWLIDGVESIPPGMLDSAPVLSGDNGDRRLRIHLLKGLSSSHPVRLRVAARRFHSSAKRVWPLEELLPLEFMAARHEPQLAAIETTGPYRPEVVGADDLVRVDPQMLADINPPLFSETPRDFLFRHDAAAGAAQIRLQARGPAYTARLGIEAAVVGSTSAETIVRESYSLRCTPKQTRIERVLVHFTGVPAAAPSFSLAVGDGEDLAARRLDDRRQRARGLPTDEESWELTLSQPRSVPFTIRAVREVKLGEGRSVSLVTLPEASDQQGTLVVRCHGTAIHIDNHRLEPIPVEIPATGEVPTVRAAFRYAPSRDTAGVTEPAVTVTPDKTPAAGMACVWDCGLESRYQAEGHAEHRATYRIENWGADSLRLTLPPAVTAEMVEGVWSDGKAAGYRVSERTLSIALPAQRRFPTVTIDFRAPSGALEPQGRLRPPLPAADLPMLARHWTVWLPPDFYVAQPDRRWLVGHRPATSWTERLFGPLGRPREERPFDLADLDEWFEIGRSRADRRRALHHAELFLQTLGASAAQSEPPGPQSWGNILAGQPVQALGLELVVDRFALSRLGIESDSPLPAVESHSAIDHGFRLLQGDRLALLFVDDVVVLSSRHQALLLRRHLDPLGPPFVYRVRPGLLAEEIRGAADGEEQGTLVPLQGWRKSDPLKPPTWAGPAATEFRASDCFGWTVYHLELPNVDPVPVGLNYTHRPTMRLFGWVAVFVVIGLGWWLAAGRPLWLLGMTAIAGCVALLVPETYVPITSGIVLGLLFCLAREMIRPRPVEVTPREPARSTSVLETIVSPSTHIRLPFFALACVLGLPASAGGQNPSPTADAAPAEPYSVFIPVDADQNPTGGRYQVPKEFYRELQQRAAGADASQGWLLDSAVYRGTVSRDVAGQRFVVENLRGTFHLRVFNPAAKVRLPLRKDASHLAPDGLLLDGMAIEPEWDAAGEALTFAVAEAGLYRLELVFRPAMLPGGGPGGFDMAIPRSPSARLELSLAPGGPVVEVPSARGTVRFESDPTRLVADLGPTGEISVRWSNGKGSRAAPAAALEIEQLLWLKVHPEPDTSVVDMKLVCRSPGRGTRELQLAVDPSIRLLELRGENPPNAEVSTRRSQPSVIALTFDEPIADQTVVEASLLLGRSPGVGRTTLPAIEVLGARTTRRLLAVSFDPTLERVDSSSAGGNALAVPEFLDAWGEANAPPQEAYALNTRGEPVWSLAVRPREPQTTMQSKLVLSFDRDYAHVRLDAELDTTQGYRFRYRVGLPKNFDVAEVSVREEAAERVARWAIGNDGRLVVFFDGPVSGQHTFGLEGRWLTEGVRKAPLPSFVVEGVVRESSVAEIFRRRGALVGVPRIGPKVEIERSPDNDPSDAKQGRLVARLRSDAAEPLSATLALAENRPNVRGEQLIRLIPRDGAWVAEFDGRIEVNDGLLDEIELALPASLVGPFRANADPAVDVEVVQRPDGRRLVLRPSKPIAAGIQFLVSSPLAVPSGSRPEAPRIKLLAASEVREFVSLPLGDGERTFGWETRGLKPTPLPDGFLAPADTATFSAYEVIGQSFEAVLTPAVRSRRQPRVAIADVRLAWDAGRTLWGVATYDVQPGGTASCQLRLPPGYRLVRVAVGGVPAAPRSIAQDRYEVPLGPKWLAQRVEVVFNGTLPEEAGIHRQTFDAPNLVDLPVGQTLWTVTGPPTVRAGHPVEGEPCTRWSQQLARLQAVSTLIEETAVEDIDRPNARDWYRRWIQRMVPTRHALLEQIDQPGVVDKPESVRAAILAVDQRQAEIAARLGTADLLMETYNGPPAVDEATSLRQQLWSPDLTITRSQVRGPAAAMTIEYEPARRSAWAERLFAAIVLSMVVLAGAWSLERGQLFECFCRWPALFGVALGLAWWLWLWPSLLGWIIVLVSLGGAMFSAWRRSAPPPGSSVIAIRSLQR